MRWNSLLLKIVKFTFSEIRKAQKGWSLVILEDKFSDLKTHDRIDYRLSIYRATQSVGVENYWQKLLVNLYVGVFFYNMLNSTREIQMKNLKSAIKIQNTARLSCKLTVMILMVWRVSDRWQYDAGMQHDGEVVV
jgi:hypothetical protein